MIGIVVSRADSASAHIGEQLRDLETWETVADDTRPDGEGGGTVLRTPGFELREFDAWHLDLDGVGEVFADPEFVVFAARHAGDTGRLLTAHHTGNFGSAEFGGRAGELAETCPNAQSKVLAALTEHAPEGYDVGIECTHHGPSDVGAPSMFVELGSSEDEWADPAGARAVARAILDLAGTTAHRDRQLVGFGGGHYAARFERVVRETDWAVGHIGADWTLDGMDADDERGDVLRAAGERSETTVALVDGGRTLAPELERLDYRVVSETWLRETSGLWLSLADRLEAALTSVDDGLRFGTPAQKADGDAAFTTDGLPPALLAEAEGIDAAAVRETVESRALAFETEQGGTRLGGRIALREGADREPLVDSLVRILREKYGEIERRDGAVVVHERAFDPEKARAAGVSEGPKFGRLADGESVCVDDRTVESHTVHTDREHRFPLDMRGEEGVTRGGQKGKDK